MRKALSILLVTLAALATLATAQTEAQTDTPATVVDLAAGNPEFSTLVSAVQTAGLAETLSSEGPFTVFAPTNTAFENALAELDITAEELMAREDLSSILTYHVVPSSLLAADALSAVEDAGGELMVTTANGADLAITVVDGVVTLNGVASVTTADLVAGNGVVHVIDAVLLPPTQ